MIMQLSLVLLFRETLPYINTISTFNKGGKFYINVMESYKVLFNYIFYIIRVKNKILLIVRTKSVIKTIVLRILFY